MVMVRVNVRFIISVRIRFIGLELGMVLWLALGI